MWNKYILLIPSAIFLKKYIKSIRNKESLSNPDCSTALVKSLHKHVHYDIINEIHRILSQPDILELIECIHNTNCSDKIKNINGRLLTINIPILDKWTNEEDKKLKDQLFDIITDDIVSKITQDTSIDIDSNIKNNIIKVYLKDIYINQIDRYNNDVIMRICSNKTNKDQLKYCDQIINKLIWLYPQYPDNFEYLKQNDSKRTVLEQALFKVQDKFNRLDKDNKPTSCTEISNDTIPVITDNLLEKIKSIKDKNSNKTTKSRLDLLRLSANLHEKKKKVSDLTLREIIYNTNSTVMQVFGIISEELSKVLLNKSSENSILNIINILKKDDNIFYIGIFFICLSILMYAMTN